MFLQQDTQRSWTDDLPVCKQSGAGYSTNQIYREGGLRQEGHSLEDRNILTKYDDSTYLYAVFDGHEGSKAADFAMQRMAAEILLGQLIDKKSDDEIKEVLKQAFIGVERGYMESIGDLIAERTSLQMDIHGLNSYQVYQKSPELIDKLNKLNCELSAGTSAVIVLICNNKLYVANVGDSRALLCKTDSNQVLRVVQLSVDHDLSNEDEILRLKQLGLNVRSMRPGFHLGNQENTRCLGNYLVKGGYKEYNELASAVAEPIIAEPEIHGGIELDESCRFLLLMSRGLYKSLEEATGTEQVNKDLALMAVEQFRSQSTLTGVAQAVVDKIVRIHHDMSMSGSNVLSKTNKRDDMTLLVRNFNFPLPNALKSPTVPFKSFEPMDSIASSKTREEETEDSAWYTNESSVESSNNKKLEENSPKKRIKPFVDFGEYYEKFQEFEKKGTLPEFLKKKK